MRCAPFVAAAAGRRPLKASNALATGTAQEVAAASPFFTTQSA